MEQDHERTADAFTLEETYAATRRPVELAETLPPEAYTSERFFALERERVFASSWVAVGCTAQLREPGDVLVSDVAGRSIFVVRNRDGELRAFYNICRHRGTRLLDGGRSPRQALHPLPVPQLGLRPRRQRASGRRCSRARTIPADQQAVFDMEDVARVRPRRLRAAARSPSSAGARSCS